MHGRFYRGFEAPYGSGISASYESATEDAKRFPNIRIAGEGVNEAGRMLLSRLELPAAAESMNLNP